MTLPASGQAASCKRLIKLYRAETATSLYCFKCNICMFMILPASEQAISCKRLLKLHSAVLSRNAHNVVSHCIELSRVVLYRVETLTALCCVVLSRNADSVVLCCVEQKRPQRQRLVLRRGVTTKLQRHQLAPSDHRRRRPSGHGEGFSGSAG